ncbi:MAG: hypothetical protein ACREX0_05705 [Noviherbaspirillum sp.]
MNKARSEATVLESKAGFNYDKLQAVACMASSAAVSIGLIYWMIKAFS